MAQEFSAAAAKVTFNGQEVAVLTNVRWRWQDTRIPVKGMRLHEREHVLTRRKVSGGFGSIFVHGEDFVTLGIVPKAGDEIAMINAPSVELIMFDKANQATGARLTGCHIDSLGGNLTEDGVMAEDGTFVGTHVFQGEEA